LGGQKRTRTRDAGPGGCEDFVLVFSVPLKGVTRRRQSITDGRSGGHEPKKQPAPSKAFKSTISLLRGGGGGKDGLKLFVEVKKRGKCASP